MDNIDKIFSAYKKYVIVVSLILILIFIIKKRGWFIFYSQYKNLNNQKNNY